MKLENLNLSWGKKNRLAQMFKPDKNGEYHTVMLAIDHPYFYGPTTGLINPRETIRPLVRYADAISPARGTLEHCLDPLNPVPIILRVSGGNSITRKKELSDEHIITSIEQALKLNAIGVSVSVYIGTEHQAQTIKNLGKVVEEASKYDLLVMGITAVGTKLKEMIKAEAGKEKKKKGKKEFDTARYLAHAGRIILEFGADIVKTYHCPNFHKVREGIQTGLVTAGGELVSTIEALEYIYNAIRDKADGIDMGRNSFQNEHPVAMMQTERALVHQGYNVEEAYALYNKIVQDIERDKESKR